MTTSEPKARGQKTRLNYIAAGRQLCFDLVKTAVEPQLGTEQHARGPSTGQVDDFRDDHNISVRQLLSWFAVVELELSIGEKQALVSPANLEW